MKPLKALVLCALVFSFIGCHAEPPASSVSPEPGFSSAAPANSSSSASSPVSSDPTAESEDILQMSAEEYDSVRREYVPFHWHSVCPEHLLADEDHLRLNIFRSARYHKMMDQNTSVGPSLSNDPEFAQDTSPRENYLYWVVWDFPHYWMTNPVTCEYIHVKTLYPIIPEPVTSFEIQNDLILYGSENCELKSAEIDGSHIQTLYAFDTPIEQFCDFDSAMLFLKTGNAIYRFFTPENKVEKIADASPSQYVLFQQISNQELAWVEVDSSWYLDENGVPAFDHATPEERGVMYNGKTCRGSYVNWHTGKTVSGVEMPYQFAFLSHGSGDDPQHYWYDAFRSGSGCTEADFIQWLDDYTELDDDAE